MHKLASVNSVNQLAQLTYTGTGQPYFLKISGHGVLADLAKAGIPIARERQMGADGNLQAWIEDPDGNRIELMQMDPSNMQTKALQKLRAG